MKYLLTFLLLLSTLYFVLPSSVQAETSASDSAALIKYSISFPVSELGNCNSLNECKTYCSDSAHQVECLAFAKKKGFYKVPPKQIDLMTKAKTELGCSSADECRQFCSQETNWERCGEFAKKYRLSQAGGSDSLLIIKRAKEILGCDGLGNCRKLCSQSVNFDKCKAFSHQMENETENDEQGPNNSSSNSDKCAEIRKAAAKGTLPPVALEQYRRYCGEASQSGTTVQVALEYCRTHPDSCKDLLKNSPQILECSKKPGCYYNPGDGACKCVASGSAVPSDLKNYSEMLNQYQQICQQKSCSWTGTSCNCPNPTPLKSLN